MTSRRSALAASAALATSAVLPSSVGASPSTTADTARIAALEAENAVLTAKNGQLDRLAQTLTHVLRELPEGDYPPLTKAMRLIANATSEEARTIDTALSLEHLPEVIDVIDRLRALRTSAGVPPTMTTQEAIDAGLIWEWQQSDTCVLWMAANA